MVTLFSTNCPKCRVLEQKLNQKNIAFNISDNIQEVIDQGFMTAPVLKVDEQYYDFKQAIDWIGNAASKSDYCAECQFLGGHNEN